MIEFQTIKDLANKLKMQMQSSPSEHHLYQQGFFYRQNAEGQIVYLKIAKPKVKLSTIPIEIKNLPYLEVLDLSWNNITQIENLDGFSYLKTLDLRDNKITTIENLDKLPQLKTLRLSKNKISKIENLDFLTELRELELGETLISEIENLEAV